MIAATAPSPVCQQSADWQPKADAQSDRVYTNQQGNGAVLLEYSASGVGPPESILFHTSFRVSRGQYRLQTKIHGDGATNAFQVRIAGAVDRATGKPVAVTIPARTERTVNQRLRVVDDVVTISVRAIASGKIWSFVGPTRLCREASR